MAVSQVRKQPPFFHFSLKGVIHFIFFIFFVVASLYGVEQYRSSSHFPIKVVKVIGAQHINHNVIQHALGMLVNKGFFSVEVEAIKDRLLQISWISNVSVRRVWPDQIWVMITEKNPIARWNAENLLSSAGDIFVPDEGTAPQELPEFIGPEGKQIFMMQYYNKINNLLSPLRFKVARLELTPTNLWNVTLNNGMKLTVDHKEFLTHFSHFVKVYPKIVGERVADIDYVDLRYANGLAIRWKSVTKNV
jgi:cell division protein FtsQ